MMFNKLRPQIVTVLNFDYYTINLQEKYSILLHTTVLLHCCFISTIRVVIKLSSCTTDAHLFIYS